MVKRNPRVAFAPGVNFDGERAKMRKRCHARLILEPEVREATPERLEAMVTPPDSRSVGGARCEV